MNDSMFNGFPLPEDETAYWMAKIQRQSDGVLAMERMEQIVTNNSGEYDVGRDQRYAIGELFGLAFSGAGTQTNQIYLCPIMFERDVCIDQFLVNVTTGAASSSFVVGIYEADHDVDSAYPGQLVACTPVLSATSTAVVSSYVCVTLKANTLYWLAFTKTGTAQYRLSGIGNRPVLMAGATLAASEGNLYTVAWTWASNLPGVFPTGMVCDVLNVSDGWPVVALGVAA